MIIPTVIAPSVGPILGGWLVTYHSWRWIFYVNLPVGAVALALGFVFLREYRDPDAGRFDPAGFVLSAAALATLLYALSHGPERGWMSAPVLCTGLAGVVLLTALIVVELRSSAPMLALRLYRDAMFRLGNNVFGFMYGTFASVLFLLPQYLQNLRGLSAFQSGLTTFPQAIGLMLMSQVVGRIYHRIGPRRLVWFGLAGLVVSTGALTFIGLGTSLWTIRGILFTRGVFTAFAAVPLQAALYANISPADTGRASALFSAQRQVCAGLGVAALATVLVEWSNRSGQGGAPTVAGFHAAFAGAALLLAAGFVVSLRIRDADAASTIRSSNATADEAHVAVLD